MVNNDRDIAEITRIADQLAERRGQEDDRPPAEITPVRVRVKPTGNPLKGNYGMKVRFTW